MDSHEYRFEGVVAPAETVGEEVVHVPDFRVRMLQSPDTDPLLAQEAFRSIVEEFHGPLSQYASNMVGSGLGEEVVQTVFFNAWRGIGSFKDEKPGSLKGWLYTITRNTALNEQRKNTTKQGQDVHFGEADPGELFGLIDPDADPSLVTERREKLDVVVDAVQGLSEDRRRVLGHAASGLGSEEIGEKVGLLPVAVRAKILRARGTVERKVIAYEQDE